MAEEFDAIVIGAGEAGSTIASRVAQSGKRVALIYRDPFGSTCLNTGCVPSKFMIHRGKIAHLAREAGKYHVEVSAPKVDVAAIVHEKNEMTRKHRAESYHSTLANERIVLLEGAARFVAQREVVVADRVLRSDNIFIATGMRPRIPKIEGLDVVRVLTNESIMELSTLPEHLVVIGGGYIGCELGQTFRRYGSNVTIIQSRTHLCPHEEPDVSSVLAQAFMAEGIALVLDHKVARVASTPAGVRVVARAEDGSECAVEGTHVLVATGRQPNTDTLGLDVAGVEMDEQGFVRVNEYLETNVPGIWAAGDVNGQQPFTRVCVEEGKVAYANAFEHAHIKMERGFLGHAIFTDPQIGSVGLTERAARANGYEAAVGCKSFEQVEKAQLIGETTGLIKLVVDRATRRLIGCHVIGPDGANLIYDAMITMRHGGTLDEIAKAVGIFPTLQEGMEGTAYDLLGELVPRVVERPLITDLAEQRQ